MRKNADEEEEKMIVSMNPDGSQNIGLDVEVGHRDYNSKGMRFKADWKATMLDFGIDFVEVETGKYAQITSAIIVDENGLMHNTSLESIRIIERKKNGG